MAAAAIGSDTFRCNVVTPEEKVLDEDVTYVSFPAWDGQMGIAPGRAALLVKLGVGPMRLDFPNGASRYYLIEGGFAQMVGNTLSILSDKSTPAERLVGADAAAELDRVMQMPVGTEEERKAKERAVQAAREKRHLAKVVSQRGI